MRAQTGETAPKKVPSISIVVGDFPLKYKSTYERIDRESFREEHEAAVYFKPQNGEPIFYSIRASHEARHGADDGAMRKALEHCRGNGASLIHVVSRQTDNIKPPEEQDSDRAGSYKIAATCAATLVADFYRGIPKA